MCYAATIYDAGWRRGWFLPQRFAVVAESAALIPQCRRGELRGKQ